MFRGKTKRNLSFAILAIGFTATSSQIIIVREFIIVFYGNELCLGLILANWLLWGAIGSWGFGRIADRIKIRTGLMAGCEIFIAFLLPLLIFFTRSARVILKAQPGELISIAPMIAFTFVLLAPLCATLGFLFSLGARMYPSPKGARQIGYTYIFESAGSSIGGLITSLILIRYLNSIQIAMIIGSLNLLASANLRVLSGKRKSIKLFFRGIIVILFILDIYLLIPGLHFVGFIDNFKAERIHLKSLLVQWGMLGLKTSRNSIYSNLTVVGSGGNYSFFSNGLSLFTVPNPASAEQVAHFPMIEHPNPKKVLLIGGGISGSLGEILKHPVDEVDYVELDPTLIELAREWLDYKYISFLDDPRVKVEHVDGRLFVKRAKKKYDVIIIDLPEPSTAQLNRFYTLEFFHEVKNILTDNGLVSLGTLSSSNYLSGEHQKFLHCIYKTLENSFTEIINIPAEDQIIFVASNAKGMLTYDREILTRRLRERNIESLYVSEYQLPFWLEPWRVKSFSDRIREPQEVKINRDFQPVSYYYDMVLWATQFSPGSKIQSLYKEIFKTISHLNFFWFILPVLIIGTILFVIGAYKQNIRREYIPIAIMVTGFSEIAFEVIVSLAFQIIYGYMYYKLGLILTSFMIGLIIGSLIITRIMDKIKDDLKTFIIAQIAISIYPLILLGSFWIFKGSRAYFWGANMIFPLLPIIAGFMGGFQFPLATKIYLKYKTRVGRVAGLTYGVDLAGACIGSLFVSAFLVPIIGIPSTCFILVILSIIALVLLLQGYYMKL